MKYDLQRNWNQIANNNTMALVYTMPDSYRRAATFVSDRGADYITPELPNT